MTPVPAATDAWNFCQQILPLVSRSFALIIPQCPPPIDQALCNGYLLCRIADTIEDEPALSDSQRARLFDSFLHALHDPRDPDRSRLFLESWPTLPGGEYGQLIRGTHLVLAAYATLDDAVRAPLCTCVEDMVAGMRLTRPVEAHRGIAYFCRDLADLDQYCHYVAGTVGIMSSALFEQHLATRGFVPGPEWVEQGRRLGLGLQMTNIIKDCRVDAERGVSFIPSDCVDPSAPRYDLLPHRRAELIRHTISHLDAAMNYVLAVPRWSTGIRTFLLGSLFPAVATIRIAASGREYHPRIPRTEMGRILDLIRENVSDDAALKTWYATHRQETLDAAGPPSRSSRNS